MNFLHFHKPYGKCAFAVPVVLAFMLFIGIYAFAVSDDAEVTATGTSGTVTWTLYDDGTLYFEPADGESGTLGSYTPASSIPWYSYQTSITSIESEGDISSGTSLAYFFYGCTNLEDASGVNDWDTENCTSLCDTFYNCRSLTTVDLSGWDTSSVTTLYCTFYHCSSLTELDLSSWDTGNVTTLYGTFYCCSSLTSFDVSSWDVSSVTTMRQTFGYCKSLTSLNLSSWETDSLTYMGYPGTTSSYRGYGTFSYCTSLISIVFGSGWDTSKVTTFVGVFYGDTALKRIYSTQDWSTSSAIYTSYMFYNCSSLKGYYSESEYYSYSSSYHTASYAKIATSSSRGYFTACVFAEEDLFDAISDASETVIFGYLNDYEDETSSLTASYIEDAVNTDGEDTGYSVSVYNDEENIITYVLSNATIIAPSDCSSLFKDNTSLKEIYFYNWDASDITTADEMFSGCSSLTTIYMDENWESLDSADDMFDGCTNLIGGLGTAYSSENDDLTYATVDTYTTPGYFTCAAIAGDYTDGWWYIDAAYNLVIYGDGTDTTWSSYSGVPWYSYRTSILAVYTEDGAAVSSLSYLFYGCTAMTSTDLSSLDSSSATSAAYMFYGCSSLETADLSGWETSAVTTTASMFYGCTALESADLSGWDMSAVTTRTNMFYNCSGLNKISLGSEWTFGSSCTDVSTGALPTPDTDSETWVREDNDGITVTIGHKTSQELASEWESSYAGTWVWSDPDTYTVSFDLNGGSGTVDDIELYFDTAYAYEVTGDFARSGYTFTGWNTAKDGSGTAVGTDDMIIALSSSDDSEEEASAAAASEESSPSLVYLDAESGETIAFYAQWSKITTYTISFDANGGSGSMNDLTAATGEEVTLTTNTYTYSGYTFAGWNTEPDGNGTSYADGASVTDLVSAGDTVTLYAQWSKDGCYGIVFNANGGATGMEIQWIEVGGSATLNTAYVYRSPYTFSSWNTEADGSGTTYEDEAVYSNDEAEEGDLITLYAQWTLSGDVYVSEDNYYDESDYMDEEGNVTQSGSDVYPSDEYSGYWTKLSDTEWMYTFYVYDEDATYYVWEDSVDGYTGNYTQLTPYYMEDGTVVAVITNTDDNNPEYGQVSITKKVLNADGTDFDSTATFTIRVAITDGDGNALSGTDVFGDYAFKDGVATITLGDDETVTLDNIPAGYIYTVEELNYGSYTVTYKNAVGTISASLDCAATVTNKLPDDDEDDPTPADEGGNPIYMDITLAKELAGAYESTDDIYEFYLTLGDLELSTDYTLSFYDTDGEITPEDGNVTSFTSSSSGSATVKIYLKAGQYVILNDIPAGTSYIVTELAGDYTASYEITDSNNLGLINTTAAENTDENKSLSTSTETADVSDDGEAEDVTITFTNTLEKAQDITLTKVSVDEDGTEEDDDTQYEITVTFSGLSSGASIITDSGRLTADADGEIETTILITAGETITFYDIPVGATYQFTEEANDRIASYTVTDSESLGKIESASGSNSEADKDLSTAEETVNEGENITVTFTNKYNETQDVTLAKETYSFEGTVDKADNTEYEFTVVFTGLDEDTTYTYGKKTFTSDSDGKATVTVTLKGWNSVTFEALPLGATYTVTEIKNDHVAAYTVEDANDLGSVSSASGSNSSANTALSTETETVNRGEDVTITFKNTATEVTGASLQVRKVDSSGNSLGGATFSLYLYNEDGDDELIQDNITTEDDKNSDNYGWSDAIENLSAGTYYFVETEAPDGYFLSDGTLYNSETLTKYFTITSDDYGTTVQITIADNVLSILASSGGAGLAAIVILSVIFAAAAALFSKRRRRNPLKGNG